MPREEGFARHQIINLSSVQYVRSPALRVAEVCWGQSQVSEGVYLFQLKKIYINIKIKKIEKTFQNNLLPVFPPRFYSATISILRCCAKDVKKVFNNSV